MFRSERKKKRDGKCEGNEEKIYEETLGSLGLRQKGRNEAEIFE